MNAHATPLDSRTALDDQALDWHLRGRQGLSTTERARLQQWLTENPLHRQAFERWQHVSGQLGNIDRAAVAGLRQQLDVDLKTVTPRKPTPAHTPWQRRLALPLATACVAMVAYTGWGYWAAQPTYEAAYDTPRGQQKRVQLPDGSELRLDTLTHIDVALYRQRRQIRLKEGQVFFNVHHDTQQPFQVLAGDWRVTVVGTRFSVRYTPDSTGDQRVRVAVEQGLVRVEPASEAERQDANTAPDHSMLLHAGEQIDASHDGKLSDVRANSATEFSGWQQFRVTLDNMPLSAAVAEFERYGISGIHIVGDKTAQLRVTGSFDARHPGNFVRALPMVLPVRVTAEANESQTASSAQRWRIEAR